MSRRAVILIALGAFLLGAAFTAAALIGRNPGQSGPPGAAREALYYCPMHPAMTSDRPADCPICGMRMVPRDTADHHAQGAETRQASGVSGQADVILSDVKRQLIGVRTSPAAVKPLTRTIRTVGRVTYDESRLHHVHTKVEGYVEKLHANATGELVRKGQPLLSIYSPELLASSQEFILALRARERLRGAGDPSVRDGGENLVESARRRLKLFDLGNAQIEALERSGEAPRTVTMHSPVSGYIVGKMVLEGQRIEPGMNLLDIADLERVWVLADVYEYELPFVREGLSAVMTLSYLPGETFEGRVTLVYPVVSETTRTVKVRLEFANPGRALKPEMYADVVLKSEMGERLVIPESAVLSTGTRDLVFVDLGGGRYQPRAITIGVRLEEELEVLAGLAEGEHVVTSGNFLIDSESKMRSALGSAAPPPAAPATPPSGHQH